MLHHGDSFTANVKHNKLQTSLKVIITFYLRISELLNWPPKASGEFQRLSTFFFTSLQKRFSLSRLMGLLTEHLCRNIYDETREISQLYYRHLTVFCL